MGGGFVVYSATKLKKKTKKNESELKLGADKIIAR